ncbi:hypothetical protein PSACC_01959 [Paramicrosporidium saccamoebae]|uniref:Uncharacterized protein n=1 Tax=Paramicrosporidium saccamoebae TaxID=1246581 RepID=A0A2H9TKI6_9FUNG|nr:hypothetical protein PSACC_01959 [Paramicrosporidium saccamoebae]
MLVPISGKTEKPHLSDSSTKRAALVGQPSRSTVPGKRTASPLLDRTSMSPSIRSAPASRGSLSSPNPRFRAIQLELEKERELYTMHTSAAAKSFERISVLMGELTVLLESDSMECLSREFGSTAQSMSLDPLTRLNEPNSSISTKSLDALPRFNELNSPMPKKSLDALPRLTELNSPMLSETKPKNLSGDKGLIRDVSVAIKTKFFVRKPRCLMFAGAGHDDLMITSSLDGSVQYNSVRKQMTTRTVFLPSYLKRPCFPENMCSAPLLDGFVFSTVDASTSNGSSVETDSSGQASSLLFLPYRHDSEPVPIVLTSANSPHQKSISTLSSLYEPMRSNRAKLLSGGLDKTITLWELDYQAHVTSTKEVHRYHTSAVQAITQVAASPEILWSGGADCRLLGWSLKESRPTFSHRYEFRISQLLTNAHHPNSIIVTFCSRSQQLRLLDHRGPLGQGFKAFGHAEQSPTRYMRPGWSPDGNLVAFGTSAPDSRISAVNIWDLRYMNEAAAPQATVFSSHDGQFNLTDKDAAGNNSCDGLDLLT